MSKQAKYSTGGRASSNVPEVHRATDEFPAGEECDLSCKDVPDDEESFYFTMHYGECSRNRTDPDVTDDVIDTLLNDSIVRRAPDFENRYLFQREIDGFEWTLVVADDGPDESPRYALVTVYSNYHGSVGTTNRYFDRKRGER